MLLTKGSSQISMKKNGLYNQFCTRDNLGYEYK